jgi:regulator of replication initiation timing
MNIELKPELEQVIAQAIQEGVIHDADEALDITLETLRSRLKALGTVDGRQEKSAKEKKRPAGKKSLAQLFAESPFKGLDLDFERDADTGGPVEL